MEEIFYSFNWKKKDFFIKKILLFGIILRIDFCLKKKPKFYKLIKIA